MAESQSLEERLKSHAESFNGLLSLIPAKVYYGEDTSDQWQRKKQTKEEARAARIAKLNPANNKSALDVIQEREKKRKREENGEVPDDATAKPREGEKPKKQRIDSKTAEELTPADNEAVRLAKRDKRKHKREEKKVRKEEQQAKQQLKKQLKEQRKAEAEAGDELKADAEDVGAEMEPLDVSGLGEQDDDKDNVDADAEAWEDASNEDEQADGDEDQPSTATSSAKDDSPAFDFSAHPSGTSSVSSAENADVPAPQRKAKNHKSKLDKESAPPTLDTTAQDKKPLTKEETAEKIRNRLAELRAARRADVDGQPARTRAELLESRRKKTDLRKERKKALRQQAKEEEDRKREEAIARGSPLMSPSIRSPPPEESNNFAFGRVAFENGQTLTADLNDVLDMSKKKGPSDLKSAMLAANAKNARLASLDPKKQAEITEKDMWLTARKRAHGEKAKDDQSLLKKALKRKEQQKVKSANDWSKRMEGVRAGKEARQKKREDNLAKRKEDKGKKSSKGSKPKKQKKRPGFEGSFRAGGKK